MTYKKHPNSKIETGAYKVIDYTNNYIQGCYLNLKEEGITFVDSKVKLDLLIKKINNRFKVNYTKTNNYYCVVKEDKTEENKNE